MKFLLGYCIDPHLGRFDYASLPQQALMELLIDGIENKERIIGRNEGPPDIEEWKGLSMNEKVEVIEIDWYTQSLKGSLSFQLLPSTVQRAYLNSNNLSGTIDFISFT